MSRGPGALQREILRRASARRNAFSTREMASKLYTPIGPSDHGQVDVARLGMVRRALSGLVTMGLLQHDADAGTYRRTPKPLSARREWVTPLDIVRIDAAEANVMLEGVHYLGAAGYQPTFCLTTPTREAVAMFGPPVASHFKKTLGAPLELTRLYRSDDCPWPLSQFLARSLRWIKKEAPETSCVFSYADPAARNPEGRAHHGGVYVASSFVFLGEACATDHWVTPEGVKVSAAQCYRRFGTKSVSLIAEREPGWCHVAGERKRLYVYPMGLSVAGVLEAIGPRARARAAYGIS